MKAKNCWVHNNWPEWNISNIWYEFAHRVEKENDRGWRYLRSEGWRKHRCSCFESSWFEEDTVTDRHQTGPRSLLFRRFSSSRGIHSRWLPKNTSRETNTATAILRRRTNSWTDHAQKQRVCKFYESWTASSTVLFKSKKENGEEDVRISSRSVFVLLKSPGQIVRFIVFTIIKDIQVVLKVDIKSISDII